MANSLISGKGTGWLRDRPDWRDYTLGTVRSELWDNGDRSKAKLWAPSPGLSNALPDSVDLRQWCSPIEDQGAIGSCTAFAGAGLVEYSMRRAFNIHVDVSPLFLYKTTRNVMGVTGDTGAWLRDMLKALGMCGVAPEDNWPYDAAKYDQEPSAFLYALGQNYQAVRYVRLDRPGMPGIAVLERIKTMLFAGFPAAFGFSLFDIIKYACQTGEISFRQPGERDRGRMVAARPDHRSGDPPRLCEFLAGVPLDDHAGRLVTARPHQCAIGLNITDLDAVGNVGQL